MSYNPIVTRLAWLPAATAACAGVLAGGGCKEEVVFHNDDPWNDPTPYPSIGNGKILVTNSGDDSLTWFDLDTLEPVFDEVVGFYPPEREGPHHGATALDGSAYYIGLSNFVPGSGSGPHGSHGTGSSSGYLLKYDPATHRLADYAIVDRNPGDVRITPDGSMVLQSHFDLLKIQEFLEGKVPDMDSRLAVIDADSMTKLAMIPACPAMHGIAVSADSHEAYVTCWASDELAVVDLTDLTTPFTFERFPVGPGLNDPTMPSYGPYAAAVSPVDGSVWVSCLETGDVRVFDAATRTWDETRGPVVTGGAPFFGDFTADGARLYVPHQGDNAIAVIDPAVGGAPVQQIALPGAACDKPHGLMITPDDAHLLVVCEGDHLGPGTVAVLMREPAAVQTFFEVGVFPDDLILLRAP